MEKKIYLYILGILLLASTAQATIFDFNSSVTLNPDTCDVSDQWQIISGSVPNCSDASVGYPYELYVAANNEGVTFIAPNSTTYNLTFNISNDILGNFGNCDANELEDRLVVKKNGSVIYNESWNQRLGGTCQNPNVMPLTSLTALNLSAGENMTVYVNLRNGTIDDGIMIWDLRVIDPFGAVEEVEVSNNGFSSGMGMAAGVILIIVLLGVFAYLNRELLGNDSFSRISFIVATILLLGFAFIIFLLAVNNIPS